MLTLPNILTTIRLIAAPMVALMFLYFSRPYADWAALILFVGAALTDWLDGFLARAWKQESKLGRMLDPIADKAMVVIALLVLTGIFGLNPFILLPAVVIIFREIFVSGLREFMGDIAISLDVTKLAKWKTTVQMLAIALLFAVGIFEFCLEIGPLQNGASSVLDTSFSYAKIFTDYGFCYVGMYSFWYGGVLLLWTAAGLTLITGVDYFKKALPYLRD